MERLFFSCIQSIRQVIKKCSKQTLQGLMKKTITHSNFGLNLRDRLHVTQRLKRPDRKQHVVHGQLTVWTPMPNLIEIHSCFWEIKQNVWADVTSLEARNVKRYCKIMHRNFFVITSDQFYIFFQAFNSLGFKLAQYLSDQIFLIRKKLNCSSCWCSLQLNTKPRRTESGQLIQCGECATGCKTKQKYFDS